MDRRILVYCDLKNTSHLVGYLWSRFRNNKENATFEYDSSWLSAPYGFSLEANLPLLPGAFHTIIGKKLFGSLGDSAPDRWGRILMRRFERNLALKENRPPKSLMEIDYLLGVNDYARQGALRFKENEKDEFLAHATIQKIPPLIDLPKLLSATNRIINDKESDDDLRLLLAPGSSLGGARPKASILNKNNQLMIAKFPNQTDETNIVLWEAVALTLAKKAKIQVPEWQLIKIDKLYVLLLKRFDRINTQRVPYLSAMSMLNANDNELHSYLEIVDALRQFGANAEGDIKELWRRIVFNICIANTDDHLRNHGFLHFDIKGWILSPAYDMNPVPIDIKPRILSTAISLDDNTGSLALALSVIPYFKLSLFEAKIIIKEVLKAVSSWQTVAKNVGLKKHEINRMASAFNVQYNEH